MMAGLVDGWRACAGTTRKDMPETNLEDTASAVCNAWHEKWRTP